MIGNKVPVALGNLIKCQKEISILLWTVGMLISYYADLCSSMPLNAANITNNKVRTSIVFIGHHPPFVKLEGVKTKLASGFFSIIRVNCIIFQYISQAKNHQIIT